MASIVGADLFDFDCPNKYYDISEPRTVLNEKENQEWFHSDHPMHEPHDTNVLLEAEQVVKQRPSLLKNGGVAARIPQPSRKSDISESALQRMNMPPPVKTSVVPIIFSKTIAGSKRALSQSVDSSGSCSDAEPSGPKTIKSIVKQPASGNGSSINKANSNVSMSSKLEEYRQTKKVQVVKTGSGKSTVLKKPTSSQTIANKSSQSGSKKEAFKINQDMLDILKRHNEKFVAAPLYEPPRHSVRDVRKWEKVNGKSWGSLTPEERESANKDITIMKSNVS